MKPREIVYTGKGRQRAEHVTAASIHFNLEGAPEGSFILFTEDQIPMKRYTETLSLPDLSNAVWHRLDATGGYLSGVTGIQVVTSDFGLHRFTITSVEDAGLACAGELTRMNAILAGINADMRVCAALA